MLMRTTAAVALIKMIFKQRRNHWLGHVLRRTKDCIIKQVHLAAPLPDWPSR